MSAKKKTVRPGRQSKPDQHNDWRSRINARPIGGEDTGPPMEIPADCQRPESLADQIARMINVDRASREREEFGSFEDEDDFAEEDPDTLDLSPYEMASLEAEAPQDASQAPDRPIDESVSTPVDPEDRPAEPDSEAPQENGLPTEPPPERDLIRSGLVS